ncbi:MAG: MFS transporter [Gammaproteobacteria bacterium]
MFLSNLGQTYFISLYGYEIRSQFGLSHSSFGGLYAGITLTSAGLLLYVGPWVDAVRLKLFAAGVILMLLVSCLLMSLANSWWMLLVALLGLRFLGQGLSAHTAQTAISRSYSSQRIQALSLTQLGYAAGEAVLPSIVVLLVWLLGWQLSWLGLSLGILALLPLLIYLANFEPKGSIYTPHTAPSGATRAEVLKDLRFYLILPLYTAPAFILTGLWFHQTQLISERGWSLGILATAFTGYALCKVASGLLCGAMAHKSTAIHLYPLSSTPLLLGLIPLVVPEWLSAPWAPYYYLGLCGCSVGLNATLATPMWTELYGTSNLGSIRSLVASVAVISTALSPALFGLLLDTGWDFQQLGSFSQVYICTAVLLYFYSRYLTRNPINTIAADQQSMRS